MRQAPRTIVGKSLELSGGCTEYSEHMGEQLRQMECPINPAPTEVGSLSKAGQQRQPVGVPLCAVFCAAFHSFVRSSQLSL